MLSENAINAPILPFAFPDTPIVQGTVEELDSFYGLDSNSIIEEIEARLNGDKTTT